MAKYWAKVYSLLNSLSIPLMVGSCISLSFFSQFYKSNITWHVYVLLTLSIFIIYSLDHLFDAIAHKERNRIGRYRFHLTFKKPISYAIVLSTIVCFILLFFVNEKVWKFGLIICIITMIYFFMVHLLSHKKAASLLKEPIIALVYALVISGLPRLFLTDYPYYIVDAVQIDFLIVCIINLLVFTYFDYGIDKKTDMPSWLVGKSIDKVRRKVFFISVVLMLVGPLLYFGGEGYTFSHLLLFLVMKIYLIIILFYQSYFSVNERHRWWGDMVFVLPLFFVILN